MRKIDELLDPNSCLNRAKPAEWIFVLLERDSAAADTVRHWCERRILLKKNVRTDPQIVEALAWADKVDAIRRSAPRLVGSVPELGAPYNRGDTSQ